MTETIHSTITEQQILDRLASMTIEQLRPVYRAALDYILAKETDETPASITEDAQWYVDNVMRTSGCRAYKKMSDAALMTKYLVGYVEEYMVRSVGAITADDWLQTALGL